MGEPELPCAIITAERHVRTVGKHVQTVERRIQSVGRHVWTIEGYVQTAERYVEAADWTPGSTTHSRTRGYWQEIDRL